jgi:hypothetical protein
MGWFVPEMSVSGTGATGRRPVSDRMAVSRDSAGSKANENKDADKVEGQQVEVPPWAEGLRDLYQQVVDEPMPDFLAQLLARLDRDGE